jgi:ABC-type branched-subunit amino acid transport system substrate-binding protein
MDWWQPLWFAVLAAAMVPGCRPVTSLEAAAAPDVTATTSAPQRAVTHDGGGLTDQQRRGRQIYLEGTSVTGGSIAALIGSSRDTVPASLVSCGNCHGRDGHGRPEGGIEPPDLTWLALGRPIATAGRRQRPAYTAPLAGRAITMGLDSAGARLGDGMPRYRLSPQDLTDLVSYLEVLGTELDPGISPTSITLGTLLPAESSAPGLRDAIARTLRAYINESNARGGMYNRKINLEFADLDSSDDSAGRDIDAFLKRRSVFALLAPYIAGRELEVSRAIRDDGIPLIGPFSTGSTAGAPAERAIFRIHSGIDDQARALARFALGQSGSPTVAIVLSDDPTSASAAAAIADQWVRGGWGEPERIGVPADGGPAVDVTPLVERLAARHVDAFAYLGPAAMIVPLLVAADRAAYRPIVYLPGALTGGEVLDLPVAFDGRIYMSAPYLAADVTRAGQEDYDHLKARHGLPADYQAAQLAVLAAAKVLEEGLRRSGRDLSRAKLIEELERLEEFSTGYSRPLTYGSSRRIGSMGAYVLAADLPARRLRLVEWIDVGGTR